MVYEDIFDAKNACDHLSGFNVCNRYLVVLYYNANRVSTAHSEGTGSGKGVVGFLLARATGELL